jgi:alanyl-tRNA synthetase
MIERRMNDWVRADGSVAWDTTDYHSAIERGAIALFGEKYGDQVRMVHIMRNGAGDEVASRDSIELCGGTHVTHTGEIGYARIVGESSVGSGLRRIEALTGRGAEEWVNAQLGTLHTLAARLGVAPAQAVERLDLLLSEQKQRQQELETLQTRVLRGSLETLLEQVETHNGLRLLAAQVDVPDAGRLREMGDWLRDKLGSGIVVLGAVLNEKPLLLAVVTPDLVKQGYHAGHLVRGLAQVVGGGGGGRPDMAQAGGRDAAKLSAALDRVPELVAQQGAAGNT